MTPRISNREIIERLTRLEEGQNALRKEVKHRSKIHALIESFRTLGESDEKVTEILRKFNLL